MKSGRGDEEGRSDAAVRQAPRLRALGSLREMEKVYRERSGKWKENYLVVGEMMGALFPEGVPPEVLRKPQFHILEQKLNKLARWVASDLEDADSILDDAVYAAIAHSLLPEEGA